MQKQLELLQKYEISVQGIRGQHFLIDPNIRRKIVDWIGPRPSDFILEIGPGLGALTEEFLIRGPQVTAIELDGRFCDILKAEYGHEFKNLTVIGGDFLRTDFVRLLSKEKRAASAKFRVAGNLPYYITTPILLRLIQFRAVVDDATLMVQKEIGERLLAQPGSKDYGRLNILARFYANVERGFPVSKNCFSPKPRVDSVVIRLTFHGKEPVVDETLFFEIVKHSFAHRRKNILNALTDGYKETLAKVNIETVLGKAGINPKARAEELLLKDFLKLAEAFASKGPERAV